MEGWKTLGRRGAVSPLCFKRESGRGSPSGENLYRSLDEKQKELEID